MGGGGGAYYHTSRSWYPKPEETLPLSRVPTIKPLPVIQMPQAALRKQLYGTGLSHMELL